MPSVLWCFSLCLGNPKVSGDTFKVASITALTTCTSAKSPKQWLGCTHHMSHPWRRLLSHGMGQAVRGNMPSKNQPFRLQYRWREDENEFQLSSDYIQSP